VELRVDLDPVLQLPPTAEPGGLVGGLAFNGLSHGLQDGVVRLVAVGEGVRGVAAWCGPCSVEIWLDSVH